MSLPGTVFVVDDDEAIRHSIATFLEIQGIRVRTFHSAQEFLAGCAPDCTGCLIIDLRMPGMSGLELIHELERRQIALPVIVMTGHGDESSLAKLRSARTAEILEKPFAAEQMVDVVQRWLSAGAAEVE